MRNIRGVHRVPLPLEADLSSRQISCCTKVSVASIQKLLTCVQTHGLTWPLPSELDGGRHADLIFRRQIPPSPTRPAMSC